jgi:hypothetical protein
MEDDGDKIFTNQFSVFQFSVSVRPVAVFRLRAREKVFLGIEWAALKQFFGRWDDFFFGSDVEDWFAGVCAGRWFGGGFGAGELL